MNGGPESAPGCSNHIVALENASKHIIFRPLVVSGGHFEGRSVYFAFLVASFCCVCTTQSTAASKGAKVKCQVSLQNDLQRRPVNRNSYFLVRNPVPLYGWRPLEHSTCPHSQAISRSEKIYFFLRFCS